MGEQLQQLETDDIGLENGNHGAFARVRLIQILSSRGLPQVTSPFVFTESEEGPDIIVPSVIGGSVDRERPILSPRLQEVQELWEEGSSSREQVAQQLGISPKAVKGYLVQLGQLDQITRGTRHRRLRRGDEDEMIAALYNQDDPRLTLLELTNRLSMSEPTLKKHLRRIRAKDMIGNRVSGR